MLDVYRRVDEYGTSCHQRASDIVREKDDGVVSRVESIEHLLVIDRFDDILQASEEQASA